MNSIINKNINLNKLAKSLKYNYSTAHPYPHCVIDELINSKLLNQVTKEFLIDNHQSVGFRNPNEKKITLNNWNKFGPETKKIINYLNSKPFIRFLENLTGIRDLISDNKLEGGGLHQINPGGYLKIHADFNKSTSNLDRRLNVLLYLNNTMQHH